MLVYWQLPGMGSGVCMPAWGRYPVEAGLLPEGERVPGQAGREDRSSVHGRSPGPRNGQGEPQKMIVKAATTHASRHFLAHDLIPLTDGKTRFS